MLKFPDIAANNSVSGVCPAAARQRHSKGLSSWFPGAETLHIMPSIKEIDEPREENGRRPRKANGKPKRRGVRGRPKDGGPSRRGSLTPVQRLAAAAAAQKSVESPAKLDRRPIPKIKPAAPDAGVDLFDFDKFVRSLDKISLPKVAAERPTSSSSLISKYSNASSASSTYARSEASAITLRDIDAGTLEPEDSISRRGNPDTSVLDLEDDDMAAFADEVAAPHATPLRFGATLSKEASMAMLMEYEDVVKTNIQIRSGEALGSPKMTSSSSSSSSTSVGTGSPSKLCQTAAAAAVGRCSPVPSGAMSPEEMYFSQRQVNRKMQKAMSLLDRVKQIEQENVARKSPIPACYSPGRISPHSKWGRYW